MDERVNFRIIPVSNVEPVNFMSNPFRITDSELYRNKKLLKYGWKSNCKWILFVSFGEIYGQGRIDHNLLVKNIEALLVLWIKKVVI